MTDLAALAVKKPHVHGAGCGHQPKPSAKEHTHESHGKEGSRAHHHHHAAHHAQKQLGHICNGGCHHGEKKVATEKSNKDAASSQTKTTAKTAQNSGEQGPAAQSLAQTKGGQVAQDSTPKNKQPSQSIKENSLPNKQAMLNSQNTAPKTSNQSQANSSSLFSSLKMIAQNSGQAPHQTSLSQTSKIQQPAAKFLPTSPQSTKTNAGIVNSGPTSSSPTTLLQASSLSASLLSGQQPLPGTKILANPTLLGLNGFVQPLKLAQGFAQEASVLSKNIPFHPLAFQGVGAFSNAAGAMAQTGIFAALNGSLKNLSSLLFGQYRLVPPSNTQSTRNEALLQSLNALLTQSKKKESEKKFKKKDFRKVHQKDTLYLEEINEEAPVELAYLEENQPLPVPEKNAKVVPWQVNQPIASKKNLSKGPPSETPGKLMRTY